MEEEDEDDDDDETPIKLAKVCLRLLEGFLLLLLLLFRLMVLVAASEKELLFFFNDLLWALSLLADALAVVSSGASVPSSSSLEEVLHRFV